MVNVHGLGVDMGLQGIIRIGKRGESNVRHRKQLDTGIEMSAPYECLLGCKERAESRERQRTIERDLLLQKESAYVYTTKYTRM